MKLFIKSILLTIILIIFIINIDIVIYSTKEASIIFFNNIFVSIFPFIILIDILIYFDYHTFLKKIFGKIISKIFNINPSNSIIFILSILTSTPSNAIYIKSMLDNNEININDANKILVFTYFPSISFVIGTVGVSLYKNFKFGLILWLFCIINNILIGIIIKDKNISICNIKNIKNNNSFLYILRESFIKGIKTSIIILGNLILFTITLNILHKYININETLFAITSGLLEITSGIIYINKLNISYIYKFILSYLILSFSSLSILFQSFSILSDYKINIKKTLIIKLMFSLITTIILLIISILINIIIPKHYQLQMLHLII